MDSSDLCVYKYGYIHVVSGREISFLGAKRRKVTLAEDGATSPTESLRKGRKNFVHLLRT